MRHMEPRLLDLAEQVNSLFKTAANHSDVTPLYQAAFLIADGAPLGYRHSVAEAVKSLGSYHYRLHAAFKAVDPSFGLIAIPRRHNEWSHTGWRPHVRLVSGVLPLGPFQPLLKKHGIDSAHTQLYGERSVLIRESRYHDGWLVLADPLERRDASALVTPPEHT